LSSPEPVWEAVAKTKAAGRQSLVIRGTNGICVQ
jgi:hypothetical protein